jgi:hypothetical protein
MKTGLSLTDLAKELQRQATIRRDYLAPQGVIEADVIDLNDKPDVVLGGVNGGQMPMTNYAHQQMADHLGVPRRYYDRMRTEQPGLLATNINTWLHADAANQRMVRTLDGTVRAILSPRYWPLDNFDLGNAILPVLRQHDLQIMSCDLTETRMYLKAILPNLSAPLPAGMTWGVGHNRVTSDGQTTGLIVAAVVISNSDVGNGALRVEPSVFTSWCTNLAIIVQAAMRKFHIGRAFDAAADAYEVFSDTTRKADDQAFFLKVQDVTRAAFSRDAFQVAIAQMTEATQTPITGSLPKVVELTRKQLGLSDNLQDGILNLLAQNGDLTKWGLSSAITQLANDHADYEGATDLERAGGQMLALPAADWATLNAAA